MASRSRALRAASLAIVFMHLPVDTRQGLAENIGLGQAERGEIAMRVHQSQNRNRLGVR